MALVFFSGIFTKGLVQDAEATDALYKLRALVTE